MLCSNFTLSSLFCGVHDDEMESKQNGTETVPYVFRQLLTCKGGVFKLGPSY